MVFSRDLYLSRKVKVNLIQIKQGFPPVSVDCPKYREYGPLASGQQTNWRAVNVSELRC